MWPASILRATGVCNGMFWFQATKSRHVSSYSNEIGGQCNCIPGRNTIPLVEKAHKNQPFGRDHENLELAHGPIFYYAAPRIKEINL